MPPQETQQEAEALPARFQRPQKAQGLLFMGICCPGPAVHGYLLSWGGGSTGPLGTQEAGGSFRAILSAGGWPGLAHKEPGKRGCTAPRPHPSPWLWPPLFAQELELSLRPAPSRSLGGPGGGHRGSRWRHAAFSPAGLMSFCFVHSELRPLPDPAGHRQGQLRQGEEGPSRAVVLGAPLLSPPLPRGRPPCVCGAGGVVPPALQASDARAQRAVPALTGAGAS